MTQELLYQMLIFGLFVPRFCPNILAPALVSNPEIEGNLKSLVFYQVSQKQLKVLTYDRHRLSEYAWNAPEWKMVTVHSLPGSPSLQTLSVGY